MGNWSPTARNVHRTPPLRECAGGCGRSRRVWRNPWTCLSCTEEKVDALKQDESWRAFRRRLQGGDPAA